MFGEESQPFEWGGIDFGSLAFDLSATLQQASAERNAALRATLPASRVTPAAAVPDTPVGRAYLKLPELARFVVSAYAEATADDQYVDALGRNYKAEAIAQLERIFYRLACNYSFDEFAADQKGVILRILNTPLFVWDSNVPPIRFDYSPFGLIPFPMQANGNAFNVPPTIGAYWLLQSNYKAGFGIVVDFDLTDFVGYGVTWTYDTSRGFVFLEGMNASLWYSGGGTAPPHQWPKLWRDFWYRMESERDKFNDKAWLADTLKWIGSFLALTGFVGAIQAIVANGVTVTTGLKLAVSIDRFPGVELGDASKVLSALSRLTSVQGLVSNLGDTLTDSAADATSGAFTGEGANMDFGLSDISVPNPDDFGAGFDFGTVDFGGGYNFDFAADTFGSMGLPDTFDSALDSLTSGASSVFGSIDVGSLLSQLASTYVQYDIAKRTIESRGGTAPPTTRPTPGQTRTLADGTTIRTNNDGTTTVRTPDGATRTVTQGGQIITQTPAQGGLMPGVSNQALLIGGAAVLAAVLLLRRKG